jgi:hypothetical protein
MAACLLTSLCGCALMWVRRASKENRSAHSLEAVGLVFSKAHSALFQKTHDM